MICEGGSEGRKEGILHAREQGTREPSWDFAAGNISGGIRNMRRERERMKTKASGPLPRDGIPNGFSERQIHRSVAASR